LTLPVCSCFNRYAILTSPSVAVLAFSVCLAGQAFAQDIVAPALEVGAITRQTDEARPVLEGSGPRDGAEIALPSLPQEILDNSTPASGAPTLFLQAWEFSGNTLFDIETLRAVLSSVTDDQPALQRRAGH